MHLVYHLEGKLTRSRICKDDRCLSAIREWTYHHKGCVCAHCSNLIVGIGCAKCKNRIKDNAKWDIQSFIDSQKRATLQLFCSEKCKFGTSSDAMCGVCGETKTAITCPQCNIIKYCSNTCLTIDKERHAKFCAEATTEYICSNCKQRSKEKYSHCAGCHKVYYCSIECQKEHWKKEHKSQCKKSKQKK